MIFGNGPRFGRGLTENRLIEQSSCLATPFHIFSKPVEVPPFIMSHRTPEHAIERIRGIANMSEKIVRIGPKIRVRFTFETQVKIINAMPDFTR